MWQSCKLRCSSDRPPILERSELSAVQSCKGLILDKSKAQPPLSLTNGRSRLQAGAMLAQKKLLQLRYYGGQFRARTEQGQANTTRDDDGKGRQIERGEEKGGRCRSLVMDNPRSGMPSVRDLSGSAPSPGEGPVQSCNCGQQRACSGLGTLGA